jgi:hypothetical protein
MSKLMRITVLVVSLMSLLGVMSSSAGAVTWTNDGDTSFTATGGPGTLSGGGLSLVCSSAHATGMTGTAPFAGTIWDAATGEATFNNCSIAGISTAVNCTYTLTAQTWSAGPPAVTSGNIDATCNVTQGGTKICHVEGQTAGHYTNPTATSFGTLVLTESNTLKTTNATGSCPLGNNTNVTLSQQDFKLENAAGGPGPLHTGPIITRDA